MPLAVDRANEKQMTKSRQTTPQDKPAAIHHADYMSDRESLAALRRSEACYRSLVLATTSVVWGTDSSGAFVEPQPAWQSYTGQPWEEHRGWGWVAMFHPDDREHIIAQWQYALAERSVYKAYGRLWHADTQTYRHILARAVPMVNADDRVEEWVGTLTDIHEQREAAQLRRLLAAIVDSSNDAIIGKTLDAIIVSWNAGAERLYGYSAAEVVGKPIAILVPADRPDELPAIMDRLKRGERIEHYETTRVRKDGTQIMVSLTISPIRDETGTITGASAIARDITEHKRVEAALRQREQELSDFVDNAPVGLHWVDSAGRVLWVNQAELDMLGYTREEYVGHHIAEFHADPPVIENILTRLSQQETLRDYEARLRCKDGSIRYALITSNVLWQDGQFIHTRCFTRDITERKLAQQELEQLLIRERSARAEAEEAVLLRDMFFSIASHELKTPLTSLLGNAQLLQRRLAREGLLAGPLGKSMDMVVQQAHRLNKMVLALLDVSRIASGQLSIETAPVDVCALVQRVVEEVQLALHTFTVECQAPDGIVLVKGDELRLEQVLYNLVDNAIKYSPRGGPVIVRVESDSAQVRIAVTDRGMGIPEQDLPHVFQRFYRASNADAQYLSGMGIGLFVVKEIISLHGGTVSVESIEGAGSTFTVTLPPLPHLSRNGANTGAPGRPDPLGPR